MKSSPDAIAMKTITAFIGAVSLSLPSAFKIMMIVMAFDALSALFNPAVKFKRRVTILSLSGLLSLMVICANQYLVRVMHIDLGFDLAAGVCSFYAISSGVDALVNFDAAGVPIPPVLMSILLKAQGLTGKEKSDLEQVQNNQATK